MSFMKKFFHPLVLSPISFHSKLISFHSKLISFHSKLISFHSKLTSFQVNLISLRSINSGVFKSTHNQMYVFIHTLLQSHDTCFD